MVYIDPTEECLKYDLYTNDVRSFCKKFEKRLQNGEFTKDEASRLADKMSEPFKAEFNQMVLHTYKDWSEPMQKSLCSTCRPLLGDLTVSSFLCTCVFIDS